MKWQRPERLSGAMHHSVVNERITLQQHVAQGSTDINDLLEHAARLVGYASAKRYRSRGTFLFRGIPLQAASVLEVGCGKGA